MTRSKMHSLILAAFIAASGLIFTLAGSAMSQHQHHSSGSQQKGHRHEGMMQEQKTPPYYKNVDDLKEIPKTLPPDRFSDADVKRAYEVARDNPKLLLQMPCYCHCDMSAGHKSLLDCFVDEHGADCDTCVSEALLVAKLQGEGLSVEKVRERIIAEYSKKN
ncbi:MAG: CYCXC family (seleno)protein [Acidobacteriota bacterium]